MSIPRASENAGYAVLPTGLPQLDRITGIGGLPFKRIVEISGQWSTGKTTLALSLVKSAQEKGVECVWVDAEWAWDDLYARTLGVNTDTLGLLQTRAAEDSLDELLTHVEKSKGSLIVIDAVGALHPRDESDKHSGERTIGSQSSLVARFCRKIVPLLSLNNHLLVVLNHEYMPIMANGGRPQLKTSGGAKLEYHKSMWLRLSKTGRYKALSGDPEKTKIGEVIEAEIRKNKMAPTLRQSCELEMIWGRGFLPHTDLLREALEKGKIRKEGNTYYFGEEKIAVGRPKLEAWAAENAHLLEA